MAKQRFQSRTATSARVWSEFRRWCTARGLKPLPAHAWTIAAYLRVVDRRAKGGVSGAEAAAKALEVIAREHLLKTARVPTRHPTVQTTLDMIQRRAQVQGQHAALFDEGDILAETPPSNKQADGSAEREAEDSRDDQESRTRRVLAAQPRLRRARPRTKG